MIAGNRKNSSATNLCNNQWGRCSDNNDVNCFLVTWSYDTNQITFTIKAYLERNQWVGIGFNDKQQMVRDFSMYSLSYRFSNYSNILSVIDYAHATMSTEP